MGHPQCGSAGLIALTPRALLLEGGWRVSAAEKMLECLEVSGGAIVIFLRLGGIAVFGGILGAGEIDFHVFLALRDVPAQAKARGGLLLLQTVHARIHRCRAGCEMIDFVLKLL